MKSIELTQVVGADKAKVWNALFTEYGNIYRHNPGMTKSYNMNDALEGSLGCSRHCDFVNGMFVEEEITQVEDNKRFTVTVTNSSYPPAVKEMFAVYEVAELGDDKTEVKMTLNLLTDPEMVADQILGQMKEPLGFYLLGLNHYITTDVEVTMENFQEIMQAATANS